MSDSRREPDRAAGAVVGLVLGGGGARGFAHIGVLRALEEHGLRADFIFGCSMGGLLGALAASGYGAETIERIVDDCLHPWILRPGRHGAVLGSEGVGRMLGEYLPETFEELETPFAVTTVDIDRGVLVVCDSGPLLPALRATISIPGILAPVDVGNGRMLVDGGVLNNLPVDLVRARTRSPIVAVDVGEPHDRTLDFENRSNWWRQLVRLVRRGERPLTADLFMKAFLIPQAELSRRRLEENPPDVLIRPDLDRNLLMEDLDRREVAIEAGYWAAREALDGFAASGRSSAPGTPGAREAPPPPGGPDASGAPSAPDGGLTGP